MWHAKQVLRFAGIAYGPGQDAGTEIPMTAGVDYRALEQFDRIEWLGDDAAKQYAPDGALEAQANPPGPLKPEPQFAGSEKGDDTDAENYGTDRAEPEDHV